MPLFAGTSAVELPLAAGGRMMGYGARHGGARALHDALHARALYLRGAGELLLVSCEVCLIAPVQAERLRTRLAAATGVAPGRILVACVHTHSGPETGLLDALSGREDAPEVAAIFDAALQAGREAVAAAAPARLGVGRAEARIGRNRSRADGPLDPTVHVVRVDRDEGAPLAVLYLHGCHPTVLGHDNLDWSADWPWAAGARIAEALPGAQPIFLLGAHADVDPRTRGLQDLAVPGQSVGVGFDEVEALGREVGDAVAEAALRIVPTADAVVGALSTTLRVAAHAEDPAALSVAREALGLPADARPKTSEWFRLEHECTAGLPADERRERIARVRLYLRGRTAARFSGGPEPDVTVQAIRLGPLRLLGLPAEVTVDVGLAWRERVGAAAAVLSIAGGWLRYLPHPSAFARPDGHHRYEVLMSTLVPDAALHLLDAGATLFDALDREVG